MEEYKGIFVLAEQRDGNICDISYQILGAARRLCTEGAENECAVEGGVSAVLIGHGIEKHAKSLIQYGADRVYVADGIEFKDYSTSAYTDAACYIIESYKPDILLIGASALGRDLAPRLSARVKTGLTADCTKLEIKKDGLHMTRPAFGGNILATIVCPDHKPQMSTVRPGVMKRLDKDEKRKGEIIKFSPPLKENRVKLIQEVKEESKEDDITAAKVLVSVGRGAGKDGLKPAQRLASALGGSLASSRAMVDSGLTSYDIQVGQTGKTVRCECYIALGISGAVQHLAGMEESDYIIAINKDKNASIFGVADLSIVGDVHKIVPLLNTEIAKAQSNIR